MTMNPETKQPTPKSAKMKNKKIAWYDPGFFYPKTTVREFVILLLTVLGLYVGLHWILPTSPSPETIIGEINKTQNEIDKAGKKSSATLPESEQKKVVFNSITNLKDKLQKTSANYQEIDKIIKEFENQIVQIKDTTAISDSELSAIGDILKRLKTTFQNQQNPGFFWNDNKLWLEVIFWTLFGTLLYLIRQPAEYTIKENQQKKTNGPDLYLERRKPQYYLLLLQSPFLTLVTLFILRTTQFSIAGLSLNLTSSPEVLVSLAFILGLYNQVALEQFDMIVKQIFQDAYTKSVRKIDIAPGLNEVEYGTSKQFVVIPDVKVRWSIWSQPQIGTIDISTGMYIAPPKIGFTYNNEGEITKIEDLIKDQNKTLAYEHPSIYELVIIRAEREDDPSISSLAMVQLIPSHNSLSFFYFCSDNFYFLAIAKLLHDKYLRLLDFYFHTLIEQRQKK